MSNSPVASRKSRGDKIKIEYRIQETEYRIDTQDLRLETNERPTSNAEHRNVSSLLMAESPQILDTIS